MILTVFCIILTMYVFLNCEIKKNKSRRVSSSLVISKTDRPTSWHIYLQQLKPRQPTGLNSWSITACVHCPHDAQSHQQQQQQSGAVLFDCSRSSLSSYTQTDAVSVSGRRLTADYYWLFVGRDTHLQLDRVRSNKFTFDSNVGQPRRETVTSECR